MAGCSTNKISFNDFVIGIDSIGLKLATKEISDMFEYLDVNKDGYIDYQEFCNLVEERRRGIDPFDDLSGKHAQTYFKSERVSLSKNAHPEEDFIRRL